MPEKEKLKLAVFHAFFNHKGGGEKLVFDLRNNFKADLFASAVNFNNYQPTSNDSFSKELFDRNYNFEYLHKDAGNSIIRLLKRLWFFLFSGKIKKLLEYDAVIFSGNVMFIQRRLNKLRKKQNNTFKPKLIMYCHTPPRKLTDQFESFIGNAPYGLKNIFRIAGKLVLREYIKDLKHFDLIITNSGNTRKRLLNYTGVGSLIVYPPINTDKFKFISQQNYFLSYARLDDNKRIPLIINVFAKMPDKKLVICSAGPLHKWVDEEIKKRNLTNIVFEGLVTDERLFELVGNCYAGIYIPVNEDFGMTQLEIMSAGKPVIGVKEGGLLETIIEGETGILISANPTEEDLIAAVKDLTAPKVHAMKEACIKQAKLFDAKIFFNKIETELYRLLNKQENQ